MNEYYVYTYLHPEEIINLTFSNILFINKPIYIGKGKNNRINHHLCNCNRKKYKTLFYNKLNKMIDVENLNPILRKIKTFNNEYDAIEFEKKLISEIKNINNNGYLYNTTNGGDGISGYKFSDEGKKKISISNAGKICTVDTKNKISKSLKNKRKTKQHCLNISKYKIGKKLSDTTKQKLSSSHLGKDTWNKNKIKDIILQIDINGNIINEWYNLEDIKKSGYQKSNVINCCMCKRKTHKGYIWQYKNIINL